MSIYTRRGDKGLTHLYGSKARIKKDNQRIVAYGTIDELNSTLGLAASLLTGKPQRAKKIVQQIQKTLHEIASILATPEGEKPPFRLDLRKTKKLEKIIDNLENKLPLLSNFILPGGTPAAAHLHVARTIARRAEREVVTLAQKEKVNPEIIKYLNRLSDTLFTLARAVNQKEGVEEKVWRGINKTKS